MANSIKIIAFAGSTRVDSYNKKLVKIAAKSARNQGAIVEEIDLRDYPLPLYDGDLEAESGIPENALKLKDLFKKHHGLLIASPEYNSSFSAVLKNTIDWISRPMAGEESLAAFSNKVAGIMSASPGALGGLRGLIHLRSMLENIKVIVIPDQVAITQAGAVFSAEGELLEQKFQKAVENISVRLTSILGKLGG